MKLLTLKTDEIKSRIALRLSKKLTDNGFTYKKTNNQFVCVKGDFKFIYNMLLTSWSDHSSIEVRLYVSQRKVEGIYERIVGRSHKITIGNTIGMIYKSPDGRQIINGSLNILLIHDEDIEAATETLESYYFNIAEPYFNKYNNLEAIDDIINNPPYDYCPAHVGGIFGERCMKGLITARLVNNLNYDKLVAIYDEQIKTTMHEETIENYYKVREYLMYNRIN